MVQEKLMKFIKPKIIISKCLEFDACRYDGQLINNEYIRNLKQFIDFHPVMHNNYKYALKY